MTDEFSRLLNSNSAVCWIHTQNSFWLLNSADEFSSLLNSSVFLSWIQQSAEFVCRSAIKKKVKIPLIEIPLLILCHPIPQGDESVAVYTTPPEIAKIPLELPGTSTLQYWGEAHLQLTDSCPVQVSTAQEFRGYLPNNQLSLKVVLVQID